LVWTLFGVDISIYPVSGVSGADRANSLDDYIRSVEPRFLNDDIDELNRLSEGMNIFGR